MSLIFVAVITNHLNLIQELPVGERRERAMFALRNYTTGVQDALASMGYAQEAEEMYRFRCRMKAAFWPEEYIAGYERMAQNAIEASVASAWTDMAMALNEWKENA